MWERERVRVARTCERCEARAASDGLACHTVYALSPLTSHLLMGSAASNHTPRAYLSSSGIIKPQPMREPAIHEKENRVGIIMPVA